MAFFLGFHCFDKLLSLLQRIWFGSSIEGSFFFIFRIISWIAEATIRTDKVRGGDVHLSTSMFDTKHSKPRTITGVNHTYKKRAWQLLNHKCSRSLHTQKKKKHLVVKIRKQKIFILWNVQIILFLFWKKKYLISYCHVLNQQLVCDVVVDNSFLKNWLDNGSHVADNRPFL